MYASKYTKRIYANLIRGIGNIQITSNSDGLRLGDLDDGRDYILVEKRFGSEISGTQDMLYHVMLELIIAGECETCNLSGMFQLKFDA